MHSRLPKFPYHIVYCLVITLLVCGEAFGKSASASWRGVLQTAEGSALTGATVELQKTQSAGTLTSVTDSAGIFDLSALPAGEYSVSVSWEGGTARLAKRLTLRAGQHLNDRLELSAAGLLVLVPSPGEEDVQASGGERLSSREVAGLPLNKRDFSQLLLLAAGTMTDTNGAANYTQQFAVNGQRGATTMFAMDGIDTTDPEMGGATFSNFNVDAIQEIHSSAGVMPAEIGHGAAGFTNVITKSGTNQIHGSVFEFARNAAFDARNFFDRRSVANPGRIPPFVRNEFGFANGGPVVLPGIYNGRGRTFYFGQYQGFRQVLGTTQVLSVPTAAERKGIDTTTFPGDTLLVPVDSQIATVLDRYPLPNDPQGPFGARTYATSSKVSTSTDQFSVRIDHRISDKGPLFARFNFNQVRGPLTNPGQTAIDPSFAIRFFDHQRNAGLSYTRTLSPDFTSKTSFGFIRSTPFFPTINQTQPALRFADGLYMAFNSAAGQVIGAFGNLFQFRQDFIKIHGSHSFKFGAEIRWNRDSTIWGMNPNGDYTFGGGTAYSPVEISSASGQHDLHVGSPLPDALTGFLTGTPYLYTVAAPSAITAIGNRFDEAAVQREAYNFYFQDTWKALSRLTVNYGLRYEVNSRIHEGKNRTSALRIVDAQGNPTQFWEPGASQQFLYNPQPPYGRDLNGWGPRLSLEYRATDRTVLNAGAAITTLLPNLWADNFLTGGMPFVFSPYVTALPGVAVPFVNSAVPIDLPGVYTTAGQSLFATGRTNDVAANTQMDLLRFQEDLAAVSPGGEVHPLSAFGIGRDFRDGYVVSYTGGLEQEIGHVRFSASYVATVGVHLPGVAFPNSYGGADPAFAPFTQFDASGHVVGGMGPEYIMTSQSHSTYHALQVAVSKTSAKAGLGLQSSYTFSRSLDDTSSVVTGGGGSPGGNFHASPPKPWGSRGGKGAPPFHATHVFQLVLVPTLPLDRISALRPLGHKLISGWQFLNITTLTSGPPFTVFSGIQQTGAGSGGADRPDLNAQPAFSTSRTVREDYFGRGANNSSFFFIPIGVPDGTGPNQGRLGTLGRNTFRGPGFHNLDLSLIKDTTFGLRGRSEPLTLQFRAEFFNAFNLVNFGLPSNTVLGSGFGIFSHTAGPSRQIQFSLKLLY